MPMMIVGVVLALCALSVRAEEMPAAIAVETSTAVADAPTVYTPRWTGQPAPPTAAQRQRRRAWTQRLLASGPFLGREFTLPGVGPEAGTEPRQGGQRAAPETASLFHNIDFGTDIPDDDQSNVMEASVGAGGRYVFFTGNWFAARSTNGGATWSFVNPTADFADFCCDQVVTYDASRNIFLWLRQGLPATDATTKNFENEFKLGVSTDGAANLCTYSFKPTATNALWTNLWWDYPHVQLGANYAYIAYNLHNQADTHDRTVMLHMPLDSLRACADFSYDYYDTTEWFCFVPVQGAQHIMYWASNWPTTVPQNSRIAIWKWDEASLTPSMVIRDVPACTFTVRGTEAISLSRTLRPPPSMSRPWSASLAIKDAPTCGMRRPALRIPVRLPTGARTWGSSSTIARARPSAPVLPMPLRTKYHCAPRLDPTPRANQRCPAVR
jgi:hypothetical protein